jgi:Kdo2-lipid IVA lauroyltransferase/acyltransferase
MLKKIFFVFSRFPLPVLHALGALLGWAVYGLSPNYRRKVETHVRIAFPFDETARWRVLTQSIAHVGMALMELPYVWGRSSAEGAARVTEITGWALVQAAQAQGKGIIFLTPHMGSFEVTAQVFATQHPITVLYRPNRRPEVQHIIEASRARDGVHLAPTNLAGVKMLLKALKKGEAVGLLPDQVPSAGEGVWAPMFGQPAYTMTLPARLHHATGAVLVLAVGYRKPKGAGFCLQLHAGPAHLSNNPIEAATQVNQAMEALILKYPEQYYWGYERYKPPKGQKGSS